MPFLVALLRQQNALADKLRERRDKRMRKLNDKHGKERAAYLHGVDKGVGTADFVQVRCLPFHHLCSVSLAKIFLVPVSSLILLLNYYVHYLNIPIMFCERNIL